ncbi:MAG: hypothetical protein H6R18_1242 [Proteobacteria bacterium]|nr:hypothetical protein [Pseudomonadota bacterium]
MTGLIGQQHCYLLFMQRWGLLQFMTAVPLPFPNLNQQTMLNL